MTIETTKLERQVLAHERILQAIIAHIDETEPKFLERLTATLAASSVSSASEQDFNATERRAAQFIRKVEALGEMHRLSGAPNTRVFVPIDINDHRMAPSRRHSPID